MKIVTISDTHCKLEKIDIPDGDLLIHAGDLTFRGTIREVSEEATKLKALLPRFKHGIIFVPGNHDWGFDRNEDLYRQMMGDIKVLIHESITINGIEIFGSPYTPRFHDWAFNVDRTNLRNYWDLIPDTTNILVTHGPPLNILDEVPGGERVGCGDLKNRVDELPNLTHHIFGHIHEGYGVINSPTVTYINASSCTGAYKPTNKPISFEVVDET